MSWSPSSKWLFTGRFDFRTGRPYTPVVGWVHDTADGWYLPVFGATNGARYPAFYELSLRGEWKKMREVILEISKTRVMGVSLAAHQRKEEGAH